MDRDQKISRAGQAQALLDNEMLLEAAREVRAQLFKRMEEYPLDGSQEGRDRLWLRIKMLNEVFRYLRNVVEDGKIAQRDVDQMEQEKKRKRERERGFHLTL